MLRAFMIFSGVVLTSPAYAHLGHVGELAGHAHWIGIGAVVVAGVLAGAIGKLTENEADSETETDEELELSDEAPVEG